MSSVPKNLTRERLLALIACLLITFCMGTIHAFSTLIQNIEIQTSVGRMASSFVYSIALVNVTLAVFFGHILYRRLSPNLLISLIAILPLIGLFFSSLQSWLGWVIGYGFLFGLSSGLGYGLSLFIVSSITERDKLGYALGLVTASYAFGAVAFSMAYPFLFSYLGFKNGYIIGLVTLTLIVMVALICYKVSKVNIKNELNGDNQIQSKSLKISQLWFGYFLGVFAGLMAIGHAVPLIISFGGSTLTAVSAITLMTLGSAIAGIYAGWLVDRYGCKRPLLIILIVNCLALIGLSTITNIHLLLVLLVTIASLYGAVIAIYPTLVNHFVGSELSAKIYGRVFTAWGAAGLISPSLAGWLFEKNNNYNTSILFALSLSFIAVLLISKIKYTVN
jgi:OFA family oxalate/formate antiporter-like MFS transporter